MELRAQVPVSIRAADQHGHLGNQIAAVRGPIPVYVEDPVKRLELCRRGMEGIKDSKQALGAEVISRFNDFAPPTLLAQAARVNFSTRLFNLVVTNVPGPQIPLYVLGRELEDIFPVGFLPPEQALFVAIMSYNGGINFGLLADYDAVDDVDAIASRDRGVDRRAGRGGGSRRARRAGSPTQAAERRAMTKGEAGRIEYREDEHWRRCVAAAGAGGGERLRPLRATPPTRATTAEGVKVKLTVANAGNATEVQDRARRKVECAPGRTLTNQAATFRRLRRLRPGRVLRQAQELERRRTAATCSRTPSMLARHRRRRRERAGAGPTRRQRRC